MAALQSFDSSREVLCALPILHPSLPPLQLLTSRAGFSLLIVKADMRADVSLWFSVQSVCGAPPEHLRPEPGRASSLLQHVPAQWLTPIQNTPIGTSGLTSRPPPAICQSVNAGSFRGTSKNMVPAHEHIWSRFH